MAKQVAREDTRLYYPVYEYPMGGERESSIGYPTQEAALNEYKRVLERFENAEPPQTLTLVGFNVRSFLGTLIERIPHE